MIPVEPVTQTSDEMFLESLLTKYEHRKKIELTPNEIIRVSSIKNFDSLKRNRREEKRPYFFSRSTKRPNLEYYDSL